jgi:hypothetical protein
MKEVGIRIVSIPESAQRFTANVYFLLHRERLKEKSPLYMRFPFPQTKNIQL